MGDLWFLRLVAWAAPAARTWAGLAWYGLVSSGPAQPVVRSARTRH